MTAFKTRLAYISRRQWHPTPVLLPRKSHGRRSLVGCSPWGREESDRTERLHFHFSLSCIGEGNGNPLQCSCLENPSDGGAWWAAVYGVAQSQTRLKRLSSSSSSLHQHISCCSMLGLLSEDLGSDLSSADPWKPPQLLWASVPFYAKDDGSCSHSFLGLRWASLSEGAQHHPWRRCSYSGDVLSFSHSILPVTCPPIHGEAG